MFGLDRSAGAVASVKTVKNPISLARKVLEETNQAILLLEGGVQAKESLLKKIEQESQPTNTMELGKPQGKMSSKSKA